MKVFLRSWVVCGGVWLLTGDRRFGVHTFLRREGWSSWMMLLLWSVVFLYVTCE